MQKIGITGQDSVTQLGAMLQVMMKTSGTPDEAANNLRNWFTKIGAGETERNYAKVDLDYQALMNEALKKGYSTLEASLILAKTYIEKTDPDKAKKVAGAAEQMNKETDSAKLKAMQKAFNETMKTGDLFQDMQVKAALTAYLQNADLYRKLKMESAQANGELSQDLADRRATSKQAWAEMGNDWDEAMRSVGDSLRPITDSVAKGLGDVARGITTISTDSPQAAAGLLTFAAGVTAIYGTLATANAIKGGVQIARGMALASGAGSGGVAAGLGAGVAGGAAGGVVSKLGGSVVKMRNVITGAGAALIGGGTTALAAPTLSGVAAGGAASLGAAGLMVGAAGATGYGIGYAINKGIEAGLSKLTGHSTSLGASIYNMTHKDAGPASNAVATALARIEAQTKAATGAAGHGNDKPQVVHNVKQDFHFSPTISIKVDDQAKIVAAILPTIRGDFAKFAAEQKRAALHDESHL